MVATTEANPDYGPALPYTPVPFAGVIQKTDLPMEWRAATLPRPPTVSRAASPTAKPINGSGAFSLNGEVDLFQLLMSLHDAGSDLNPLSGPHPDVKRALLYLQSQSTGTSLDPTLLAAPRLGGTGQGRASRQRSLVLAAGRRNLQSAGVSCPRPRKRAHGANAGLRRRVC